MKGKGQLNSLKNRKAAEKNRNQSAAPIPAPHGEGVGKAEDITTKVYQAALLILADITVG
jgi:hypothetical protein